MRTTATEFAAIARALQAECGRLRIQTPAFRSPPHLPRVDRTVRRCEGMVVVAVRLDRDAHDVTQDMIDGVIAANELDNAEGVDTLRGELWQAAGLALAA